MRAIPDLSVQDSSNLLLGDSQPFCSRSEGWTHRLSNQVGSSLVTPKLEVRARCCRCAGQEGAGKQKRDKKKILPFTSGNLDTSTEIQKVPHTFITTFKGMAKAFFITPPLLCPVSGTLINIRLL